MGKCTTNSAAGAQTIETIGGGYALKWDDETQMSLEERRHRIIAHAFRKYGTIRSRLNAKQKSPLHPLSPGIL